MSESSSLKFLLIAHYPDTVLRFRTDLLSALKTRGYEIHVAAPELDACSDYRRRMEELGFVVHDISMHRTGTNPLRDLLTFISLIGVIRRARPQLVLSFTIKPVVYGSLAAWLCRVPQRFALITGLGHSFQPEASGGLQRMVRFLYRVALRRVQAVFFQNPDDEELFRVMNLVGARTRSCVVNGSGVDVDYFMHAPLPDGGPSFLLVGRLLGEKGVREYVNAARRIKAKYPQARFLLVGWLDSNPSSVTAAELQSWIVEGVVTYLGRLDDVRPALLKSSVYVLPSYREGTPRSVLEAMSMGRPIVTTDAPGCRETVIDGLNGFLVEPKSAESLEAALLKFVEDPFLAERMGRCSRTLAETKYDVRSVNRVMLREMGCA